MSWSLKRGPLAVEWWATAVLLSAFVLFLALDRTTLRFDRLVYDQLLQLDERSPDPRILIVAVDDASIRQVGAWPWSRETQAALLRRLVAGGPQAIAYDVLLIESLPGDEALGRAIGGDVPVFLPLLMRAPGTDGAAIDVIPPVADVRERAQGLGHVNLALDSDGKVRRAKLVEEDERGRWPHLMDLMRRVAEGVHASGAREANLIPFSGAAGHFPTIGAGSVLRGELPAALLEDRLVLVGATAAGLGDRYATAGGNWAGLMPGVEVQAQLLDGLLSDQMIREGDAIARALFALLPLWIFMVALRRLQPGASAVLVAGLMLAAIALAALLLVEFRLWLTPVPAVAGLALVYPLWAWRRLAAASRYMVEELERFRGEPDALSSATSLRAGHDTVSRQIALLHDAIGRTRDLRRFVADSLHQFPDSVFVTEREGEIILANAEGERLLDALKLPRERQDMKALLAHFRTLGGNAAEPRELDAWPAWPPEETSEVRRLLSASGRCFDVRVAPRTSATGELLGWLVRMTDMTGAWEAQRQRERTLQFLSHDMRSPQASILAVLSEGGGQGIEPGIAARIGAYARRTIQLADGFVQLARAESLRYRPEPINIADVLLDAIDDVWPRIAAKRMAVQTDGEDCVWLVSGERSLLTRAVINLLDNAVRHSPEGASLHCQLAKVEEGDREMVVCAIADQGPGIEPERLAGLFDRFQSSSSENTSGVGLGLNLVNTVALRHGGRVSCQSTLGSGATFSLVLPLVTNVDADSGREDGTPRRRDPSEPQLPSAHARPGSQ